MTVKGDLVKKYDIKKGDVIGDRLSDINADKDNGLIAIMKKGLLI